MSEWKCFKCGKKVIDTGREWHKNTAVEDEDGNIICAECVDNQYTEIVPVDFKPKEGQE